VSGEGERKGTQLTGKKAKQRTTHSCITLLLAEVRGRKKRQVSEGRKREGTTTHTVLCHVIVGKRGERDET